MSKYISVNKVEAKPMTKEIFNARKSHLNFTMNDNILTEGYEVVYPNGSIDWYSKAEFEKSNIPVDSHSVYKIVEPTQKLVDSMIKEYKIIKTDPKVTYIEATLINGNILTKRIVIDDFQSDLKKYLDDINTKVFNFLELLLEFTEDGTEEDYNKEWEKASDTVRDINYWTQKTKNK